MNANSVPQQPPTKFAPALTSSGTKRTNSWAVVLSTALPSTDSGRPPLGYPEGEIRGGAHASADGNETLDALPTVGADGIHSYSAENFDRLLGRITHQGAFEDSPKAYKVLAKKVAIRCRTHIMYQDRRGWSRGRRQRSSSGRTGRSGDMPPDSRTTSSIDDVNLKPPRLKTAKQALTTAGS
jgi:hypothetical protein